MGCLPTFNNQSRNNNCWITKSYQPKLNWVQLLRFSPNLIFSARTYKSRNIWPLLVLFYWQSRFNTLHFVFAWKCSRPLAVKSNNHKHKVNGNHKPSENRMYDCHLFISKPTYCVVMCLTHNSDSILSLRSGSFSSLLKLKMTLMAPACLWWDHRSSPLTSTHTAPLLSFIPLSRVLFFFVCELGSSCRCKFWGTLAGQAKLGLSIRPHFLFPICGEPSLLTVFDRCLCGAVVTSAAASARLSLRELRPQR